MLNEVPKDTPTRSSWGWWVGWALFLLFVVYPLSTGPVCRLLLELGVLPDCIDALETVYAPLIYLSDAWEPLEDFFVWYLQLWGV